MKTLSTIVALFFIINGFSQLQSFEGKWYVEKKTSKSDFDIPDQMTLIKDSAVFDSKTMVDSMYCKEYFLFESDSNFNCIGECHAYDPKNNWFSNYGSYGMWGLKEKSVLKLDYVHGLHITHCEFKIKRQKNKIVLTRTKMETVEIKQEYELKNKEN